MPTPNMFRLNIIWQRSTVDAAVNVMHYDLNDGVPLGLSEQDLADVFADAVGTAFAILNAGTTASSLMHNTWSIDRITLRDMRIPNQPEYTSTVAQTGLNTGANLPSANAVVGTLRTALAGRSYRGRVYVPGWSGQACTVSGAVSSPAREAVEDFILAIGSNVASDVPGAQLVVYSRTLDETNAVTSVQVRDDQWDVQRRRNVPGI